MFFGVEWARRLQRGDSLSSGSAMSMKVFFTAQPCAALTRGDERSSRPERRDARRAAGEVGSREKHCDPWMTKTSTSSTPFDNSSASASHGSSAHIKQDSSGVASVVVLKPSQQAPPLLLEAATCQRFNSGVPPEAKEAASLQSGEGAKKGW